MKYLKSYESHNNYKVGDYIKLKYHDIVFKIIKINYKWANPFRIEYYNDKMIQMTQMNCKEEDIERYSTTSEIEDMKLQVAQNKYNL